MDLDTLIAERDIGRTLSRLARAMDERDWAALEAIYLEDATADMGVGLLRGREAIVASLRSFLDECGPTQHLLGNLVIDVEGDRATSRCYVADMHVGAGDKAQLNFRTLGEYHDAWVRRDGAWRITHRRKLSRALIGSIEVLGAGRLDVARR